MQMADGSGTVQLLPVIRQVPGLMERPDGNNVNLDREGLLMAETQLQYELGIQLVKSEFHQSSAPSAEEVNHEFFRRAFD